MNNGTLIQTNVLAQLSWSPSINAAHIGVTAKNGVVTLTGQVAHYTERAAAEESTKGVFGVRGIANDIQVDLSGSAKRTDQDIAEAALRAMAWDFDVPHDKIQVVVNNGRVTLDGTVDWQYQKDGAERCVRYLMGVTAVINSIAIKPSVKSTDVKDKIEEAFHRNANLDPRHISVETHAGTVTLTGRVSSWFAREEAIAGAWSAPGVTSVKDELRISP